GRSRSWLAVPSVTVARAKVRTAATAAGLSAGGGLFAPAGVPASSCGGTTEPCCNAAATNAMASGLTSTLPWPIASAASSPGPSGAGSEPENDGTGSCQPAPMPYPAAVPSSAPAGSRCASAANVVLQECANASRRATEPRLNESSLCTTRPPRVTVPGQGSVWVGPATRLSSTAVAVTILNVDPAG